MITLSDREILIDNELFDPRAIFECGQVFRYDINSSGDYIAYSGRESALIKKSEYGYKIVTDNTQYFYNYFDLSTDYSTIIENITDKPLIKESVAFGGGLRILRQQYFECLISFIISANNNIKRIRGIIQRLSDALGEDCGAYRAFPTPARMAETNSDFYENIGAGYRARYLADTARAITSGFDLSAIAQLTTSQAKRELMQLKGVGSKVADCVLLFAYGRKDVFPVDTWIKKVYGKLCGDKCNAEAMRNYLLALYGEYAGYAQQYLFYAHRSGII